MGQRQYFAFPVVTEPVECIFHEHGWEAEDTGGVAFGLRAGSLPELLELTLGVGFLNSRGSALWRWTPATGATGVAEVVEVTNGHFAPDPDSPGEYLPPEVRAVVEVVVASGMVTVTPVQNGEGVNVSIMALV